MKALKYFTCIFLLAFSSRIYSQIPDTSWTKTFGGPLADVGNSVKQTNDGGFVVAATTSSFGAGGQDIWLIKTDENGDTLWTKTFGGTGNDRTANVVQTNDNGYAIFGTTNSFGNGGDDFLLWKTDSLGNTEWYKTFGTGLNENAMEGLQTIDNGFILVGNFYSYSYKTWVIKLDNMGNEIWNKVLIVGSSSLLGKSIQQTVDIGFAICGTWEYWYNGSRVDNYFLYRLTENGDSVYYKYYGFSYSDAGNIIRNTKDGNLIIGGSTECGTNDQHAKIVKVNSSGNVLWSQSIPSTQKPVYLSSIESTSDSGFILTVASTGNVTSRDFQLLKTNNLGELVWSKIIGGSAYDFAYSVYPTSDKGYIVTGETKSFGAGNYDIWLLKFKSNPSPEIQTSKDSLIIIYDNLKFTSKDSLVIYNTGNATLNIDTIYSTNASGFVLDVVLNDTTIHTAVTWRNNYYNPFQIEPNDSAKLIFTYPLWIPKSNLMKETWSDTVVIINNSLNNGFISIPATIDFPVGVGNDINSLPTKFSLHQNYPNPFNPSTKIIYEIPEQVRNGIRLVTLKVYDVLGNEVATLVNEEKQAGTYEVEFDASNHSSGIYYYQLQSGSFIETKKMVFIK